MKLKDYQFLLSIQKLTDTEQLSKQMEYLGVSYEKHSIDEIRNRILKTFAEPVDEYRTPRKWFYVKGHGIWKVAFNIRKETGAQFTYFESLLYAPTGAEGKDIVEQNLHNLLAVYIRPLRWYGIEKWDIEKHERNANILLNVDMKYIYPMIDFFFLNAKNFIRNTNITSLNQQTNQIKMEML